MTGDQVFMRLAIQEAQRATAEGNQPFGSLVVDAGRIIGRGRNLVHTAGDATAHAELLAVRDACRARGTFALEGATLYTTCEPCLMCTGAIASARLARVVIGAVWADAPGYFDHPEKGSLLSLAPFVRYPFQHVAGVLRQECARLYGVEPER